MLQENKLKLISTLNFPVAIYKTVTFVLSLNETLGSLAFRYPVHTNLDRAITFNRSSTFATVDLTRHRHYIMETGDTMEGRWKDSIHR